ncbi:hypothetical protein H2201_004153 [Coniosporium apollinis]|uniref:F-box domain-containing protein n=1 Tax=Coniosporium apollinis TaxID=61459 RepID=A0ABQ9NTD2_9PEZI|nr:hypothetical protein H2201_004153 [Coniosporium apollinis]
MDRLSTELLAAIISYLEPPDLINSLTVSRQWQFTVERHTFRSPHVRSSELDRFATVFSASNRAGALVKLNFHIVLPAYSDDRCAKFENEKEKKANNEAFTDALIGLFKIFHSWENSNAVRTRPFALNFGAYSPSDPGFREERDRPGDLMLHRYEHSFLSLLKPEELPSVESITHFPHGVLGTRCVAAAAIATIAAKLPALESIDWELEDAASPGDPPRYQSRYDFAQALFAIKASKLKSFSLSFPFIPPQNEFFEFPSAIPPNFSPTDDPLSSALYAISQIPSLQVFRLLGEISISPSLFGPTPSTGETPIAQPATYPSLEAIALELNRTTPSGDWLFAGDPADADLINYDSDTYDSQSTTSVSSRNSGDSDDSRIHDTYHTYHAALARGETPIRYFRSRIAPELFDPLVRSLTQALSRMPKLNWLNLELRTVGEGAGLQIFCLGPERPSCGKERDEEPAVRRLEAAWGRGLRWTAPEDVTTLLEEWAGAGGICKIGELPYD